jgi:hypothetical protein
MKHFDREEFACKCCGKLYFDEETLVMFDIARGFSDTPYKVNSGCRCDEHNKLVGGSESSSHRCELRPATAADISVTGSTQRFKILKGLILAGFTRIGIAKNFIHADNDPTKPSRLIWLY